MKHVIAVTENSTACSFFLKRDIIIPMQVTVEHFELILTHKLLQLYLKF